MALWSEWNLDGKFDWPVAGGCIITAKASLAYFCLQLRVAIQPPHWLYCNGCNGRARWVKLFPIFSMDKRSYYFDFLSPTWSCNPTTTLAIDQSDEDTWPNQPRWQRQRQRQWQVGVVIQPPHWLLANPAIPCEWISFHWFLLTNIHSMSFSVVFVL